MVPQRRERVHPRAAPARMHGRAAASVRSHRGRQSLTNTIVQWPWGDTHAPITWALFANVIRTSSRTNVMDAAVVA
jgi:hypothetical protein